MKVLAKWFLVFVLSFSTVLLSLGLNVGASENANNDISLVDEGVNSFETITYIVSDGNGEHSTSLTQEEFELLQKDVKASHESSDSDFIENDNGEPFTTDKQVNKAEPAVANYVQMTSQSTFDADKRQIKVTSKITKITGLKP
ncbi:hypothetical protein ACUXCC_001508 [Cytobacillus horneckiae]|uniref:Uncharacterized protein n=3 Tax=Cytobacillus horneckiae TaxID=549687 RepID=A0A2N0ZLC4_9BACI|nr:hypothetical protein [Cytobacillus horneckiae]MBN6885728.1 hypothetical protein [Cytobacillus horneckiae]MEC1156163.1 hypothetical protein [Cytobacillus horneckiae]MED2937522.1 hypothetical protein [Cytobacillus horneckiae]PKG30298.1 hypothetical protein CWS20_04720 [Cytobacillus horneckiae]